MDRQITEKLDALLKYVPFIDFIVDIDKETYVKFIDIKKWIINKKRYPLSDLEKIEQSIITQYKNIMGLDKKIPLEINKIFSNELKHQYIDLCSDDEENNTKTKNRNSLKRSPVSTTTAVTIDSDDDLEIVSIYEKQTKTECNSKPCSKKEAVVVKQALDDISFELLEQIDHISNEEKQKNAYVEPPIYHEDTDDNDEKLFHRRTANLFKRRDDFEDKTKQSDTAKLDEEEHKSCKTAESKRRRSKLSPIAVVHTISLDSSDDEVSNSIRNIVEEIDALSKESPTSLGLGHIQKTSENTETTIVDANNDSKLLFTRLSEVKEKNPEAYTTISDVISSSSVPNGTKAECRPDHVVKDVEKSSIEMPDVSSSNGVANGEEEAKSSSKDTDESCKSSGSVTSIEKPDATSSKNVECILSEIEKCSKEQNNSSPITSIDLSSLDNLNMEELLSCIIKVDENKNANLESLLLKTILRRLRSSASEEQDQTAEVTTTTNCPQNENIAQVLPTSLGPTQPAPPPPVQHYQQHIVYPHLQQPQQMPLMYQNPYGYQHPMTTYAPIQAMPNQRKLNPNDPRIRNFLNKFKNSPLLTPLEREMATNFGNKFMQQVGNVGQGFVRPAVVNPALSNNHTQGASNFVQYCHRNAVPQMPVQNIRTSCIPQTETPNRYRHHSISYAEYKRRKAEEQMREEKLREDERKRQEQARIKQQALEEIQKRDTQKTTDEIRSILFNTLQSSEEKIASVWESQKKASDSNTPSDKIENECPSTTSLPKKKAAKSAGKEETPKKANSTSDNSEKECQSRTASPKTKAVKSANITGDKSENKCQNRTTPPKTKAVKSTAKKDTSKKANEDKIKIDRVNRAIKELECTFKGFDRIQDYIPKAIGGRRRSSVSARTAIAEQLNSLDDSEISSSQSTNESYTSPKSKRRKTVGEPTNSLEGKRRSSLHARTAITEQLNSSQPDDDDVHSIPSTRPCTTKRRKTTDELKKSVEGKRRSSVHARTAVAEQLNVEMDDDIPQTASKRVRVNRIIDDVDEEQSTKIQRLNEINAQKQLKIVLKRLTEEEIREHSKRRETTKSNNILSVHLIESRSQPVAKAVVSKKPLPKRLNNDCEMTESNTKFCTLCSSKPSDLTNHYVRKHKSESYVSRLTWSQLDELCINPAFAEVVGNGRVTRYAVKCPFCEDKLVEPFLNLYNHYSTHTGEYAFQCSGCQLEKPFRADIVSHQLHSKTCRGSHVQIMYRYPPNAMVIYLHYCTICNFVQLNEANVLRHLRDHHDKRQSIPKNVQKCILVAISDGPDASNGSPQISSNESSDPNRAPESQSSSNEETSVVALSEIDLNDDIPVRNEACSEELFDLDEQLKQMHEEEPAVGNTPPMTVVHFSPATSNNLIVGVKSPVFTSKHVPKIFKSEPIDIEDNSIITPPRPFLEKISANHRSTYRSFPSNVKYLGLYKCMADDCYYSTDSPNEFLGHLEDHGRVDGVTGDYLQCAYCSVREGVCISTQQLVDHIRNHHMHMIYQCSMCCYRSCEASNVAVHQKVNHAHTFGTCTIYKCSGTERSCDANYLNEKIAENIRKLPCTYCSHKSFYHSNLLEDHIRIEHNITIVERLMNYSCIYCPLMDKDISVIRQHLALDHPEEQPYLCDHNIMTSITDDILHNMKPLNLSEAIAVAEVNATLDYVGEDPCVDVKPNAEELLKGQEETVKVRLRKLTEKSGVAPDSLYRCPEQTCGGFFSIYDLWLRHMRVKHFSFECQCPHCSTYTAKSLIDYKAHFEEHRRHTYICFHCPLTFGNQQDAVDHVSRDHVALGSARVEKIRFNLSYSYFVLIQTDLLTDRSDFMPALLDCLNRRLQEQESNESMKLKHNWLVPIDSSTWLEDYPNDICHKLRKKCFSGNCDFRAIDTEVLFRHVRETHNITGSTFNCCQCDFHLENCRQWDGVLNHIQQHSDIGFFICGACYSYHYSRSKISTHIREGHAARDVPIINLTKKMGHTHLGLAVVFANECLTFSTMRNCFCCEERDMNGDAFSLHLKRYHKFVLNYFCEWCNLPVENLQAAEEHFKTVHTRNRLKIRCEFASKSDVSVASVRDFRVLIDSGKANESRAPIAAIKPELADGELDNDDSVIILEDDDVVVEKFVREQEQIKSISEKPKLKCVATTNLVRSTIGNSSSEQVASLREVRVLPRIKIVNTRQTNSSIGGAPMQIPQLSSVFSHQQMSVQSRPMTTINSSFPPQQSSGLSTNVPPLSQYNQYGPTLSGKEMRSTVIQRLPNEIFVHSNSQVTMPTSNMERPMQHTNYPPQHVLAPSVSVPNLDKR